MLISKKQQSQEMDDLSNHRNSLYYIKGEAEICQDKSESKTTVGSLNQIISQKNNQILNKQNNQVKEISPSITSKQTSYTLQDASHMQTTQIHPQIQMITPIDYQSYYMNSMILPQQSLQVPSQFMNPIQNHPQQLQPQQMMIGNNNQLFPISNLPIIQPQQPNPIFSYNMVYNPLHLQNMQQMGVIPTISTLQQRDQFIIPSSDNQNSLENIQKSEQEKQKQQTTNQQNQQMAEIQLNPEIKNNGVLKQDTLQKDQQYENDSASLDQSYSNQLRNQTKNRNYFNENIQVSNEKIIQTHQKSQNLNENKKLQKLRSPKQVEKNEIPPKNIQINNNNLNNQPYNNNQYSNSKYQKDTIKQSERKIQCTGDYLNSYEKLIQKNVINYKQDHQEKYKSNICCYRKIKRNDLQIKVIYSITPNPMLQSFQDEVSQNYSSSEFQNQQGKNHLENNFKTSKQFSDQSMYQINSQKDVKFNQKIVSQSPSSNHLKKRKLHETHITEQKNSQSLSQNFEENKNMVSKLFQSSGPYENSKDKKDSINNLNYFNENVCSQGLKFQVSDISSRKYIKTNEGNQQLNPINYQSTQNKNYLSYFEDSPHANYISRKQCKIIQKSDKTNHIQKEECFKEQDVSELFPELEEDEEWEDSFFKDMKAHTKSGEKSFFLVHNYKKKLIQQLMPEDQNILKQMKQAKKFNFSKNVIKQFLKVMNQQINYVYKFSRSYPPHFKLTEDNQSIQQNRNEINDSKKSNMMAEHQSAQHKQPDFSSQDRHFIDKNNPSSTLSQNQQFKQKSSQLEESVNLNNQVISLSNNKLYTKVKNPSRYQLNYLRKNIKEFLTFNSYTHSSIKKIIAHDYYSLYFRDFLEVYCDQWIEQGKTKYKNEQKIMIQFLLLCLRNRKLLIFLSQHDPQNGKQLQ